MSKMSLSSKLLVWSMVLIVILFLLAPVNIGPVKDFRFMHILRETGLVVDHRTPTQLISSLQSSDLRVQVYALMTMSRQANPDPQIVRVLREFIDSKAPYSLQDLAIYALGELRIRECLPQLGSRLKDKRYDQEVLKEAIDKIAGRVEKPFWKSMF